MAPVVINTISTKLHVSMFGSFSRKKCNKLLHGHLNQYVAVWLTKSALVVLWNMCFATICYNRFLRFPKERWFLFFFFDLATSMFRIWETEINKSLYGGFLKWWYPQNTPKWSFLDIFSRKTLVVGYHHFRKPPYCSLDFLCHSLPSHAWNLKPPSRPCHLRGIYFLRDRIVMASIVRPLA